jgi:hypothetical protein
VSIRDSLQEGHRSSGLKRTAVTERLTWRSSRDGRLGEGSVIAASLCAGEHELELHAERGGSTRPNDRLRRRRLS